jgi:hypothetical protein
MCNYPNFRDVVLATLTAMILLVCALLPFGHAFGAPVKPLSVAPREAQALTDKYLHESSEGRAVPKLVVAYYDDSRGLLAGYQSSSGKRLVFRSSWRVDRQVSPQVAHLNRTSGEVEVLMGPSRSIDQTTGRREKVYRVSGVDLLKHLQKIESARINGVSERDEIDALMASDAGLAFAEAVPALFAKLEELDSDASLAALQAPFGAVLVAMAVFRWPLNCSVRRMLGNCKRIAAQATANIGGVTFVFKRTASLMR